MSRIHCHAGLARQLSAALATLAVLAATASAQYAAPADYYATVTGNPATLKSELHLIISSNYWTSRTGPGGTFVPNGNGHFSRTYDDARFGLQVVDSDVDHPGRVILVYDGASVPATWDNGETWNREHRWPDSIGLGSSGPDYSDMHQLSACNPSINSARGNRPYGTPTSIGNCGPVGDYWYPGDADQPDPQIGDDTGDSARAVMYMAVRYDGQEGGTVDLELKNGLNDTNRFGDLAAVLTWHYRDMPCLREERRNHLLFSSLDNPSHYQGNRNPFVDHPEYAWAVFGTTPNDSKLYLGATSPGDGGSSATVDFGNVPVGSALPAEEVTLNKLGSTPACYGITAVGSAACSAAGLKNGFGYGAGSRILTVSLPAGATDAPGLKTGTITIDNLELTSAAVGTGSLDENDTINVSVNVYLPNCGSPFADADHDGDVDMSDFGLLQVCMMVGQTIPVDCICFDTNGDAKIDAVDVARFQACVSSPGVPTDPGCGG